MADVLTDDDLDRMLARANREALVDDVPRLVAEVRLLRSALENAQGNHIAQRDATAQAVERAKACERVVEIAKTIVRNEPDEIDADEESRYAIMHAVGLPVAIIAASLLDQLRWALEALNATQEPSP